MEKLITALCDSNFMTEKVFGKSKVAERTKETVLCTFAKLAKCLEKGEYESFFETQIEQKEQAPSCEYILKKGGVCKLKAYTGSKLCSRHGGRPRCSEEDCTSFAKAGTTLCLKHTPKVSKKIPCAAKTKKGTSCKKYVIDGSEFCRAHQEYSEDAQSCEEEKGEKQMCTATTTKGEPCKKAAVKGSDMCKIHLKKDEEEKGEKQMCTATTTKGEPCKKAAVKGSDMCKIHLKKDEEEKEEKQMCTATTTKGQPCKRAAIEGLDKCNIHSDSEGQDSSFSSSDEEKICEGVTKKGVRCTKKAIEGGSYCPKHNSEELEKEMDDLDFQDERQDPSEPFDIFEFDGDGSEEVSGTDISDKENVKAPWSSIRIKFDEPVKIQNEEKNPTVMSLIEDIQLVKVPSKRKGIYLFEVRKEDDGIFPLKEIKKAIDIIEKEFNVKISGNSLVYEFEKFPMIKVISKASASVSPSCSSNVTFPKSENLVVVN